MTTVTIHQANGSGRHQPLDLTQDFERTLHAAMEEIGERFGLYNIMVQDGPITPGCLATQAGISYQSARVWLEAQALASFLCHCTTGDLYSLSSPWPRRAQLSVRT